MPPSPEQPSEPLLEQLKPTENPDLVNLRQEVETGLQANLDRLVAYCQNHSINFADWKNFDGTDTAQYDQIQEVLTLLGAHRLLGFLDPNNHSVSTEQREEALDILHNIAGLMERRTAVLDYTRSQHQAASESASSDTAGKTFDHLKELAGKHPLATAGAGLIALWGASALWNATFGPKDKPWFKYLGIAAGVAWASNKLSPIFLDGRYLTDIIRMDSKQVEGMMDEAEERLKGTPVNKEAFRAILTMGEIPLSVFLDAYQRALDNASTEIDMKKFRVAARGTPAGRKIDDRFFDKRLGAPLFLEIQRLVGSRDTEDVEKMRERYCIKEVDFNVRQAFLAEYDPASDDAAQIADATKGWLTVFVGTAEAAEGLAERRRKYDMELSKELRDIPEFKALDVWVYLNKNSAKVKGVRLSYNRIPDTDADREGQFEAHFSLGSKTFEIDLGALDEPADVADRKTVIVALETEILNHLDSQLVAAGFAAGSVPALVWNSASDKWMFTNKYTPSSTSGYPVVSKNIDLLVDEDNNVRFDFQGYQGGELRTVADLDQALVENHIVSEIQKIPELTLALGHTPLEVISFDPYNAAGTTTVKLKTPGGEIELVWTMTGGTGRPLDDIAITPTPVFAETREQTPYPAFDQLFGGIRRVSRNLSNWRMVSDVLALDLTHVDDFNYFWQELVDFKQAQIRADYKNRLLQLPSPATLKDLYRAYDESIGKAQRELDTLAHDILVADQAGNKQAYERLVRHFYDHGFSSSDFKMRYHGFIDGVSFDRFDFAGSEGLSGRTYNRLRFLSERALLHYTMQFKDDAGFHLDRTKTDYFEYVQDQIFDLLRNLENLDSSRWEFWVNSAISEQEFIQFYPALFELHSYDQWLNTTPGRASLALQAASVAAAVVAPAAPAAPGAPSAPAAPGATSAPAPGYAPPPSLPGVPSGYPSLAPPFQAAPTALATDLYNAYNKDWLDQIYRVRGQLQTDPNVARAQRNMDAALGTYSAKLAKKPGDKLEIVADFKDYLGEQIEIAEGRGWLRRTFTD